MQRVCNKSLLSKLCLNWQILTRFSVQFRVYKNGGPVAGIEQASAQARPRCRHQVAGKKGLKYNRWSTIKTDHREHFIDLPLDLLK
jgi:hypothetical protein